MKQQEKKKYKTPKLKIVELTPKPNLLCDSLPCQDEIDVIKI
jgi:hypothetical protein